MSSEDPPQTLSGRIRAFISSTPSPSDTDKTGVVADKRNPLGAAQSPVSAPGIAMHHSDIQQAPSVVAADQAKTEGPSAHNRMSIFCPLFFPTQTEMIFPHCEYTRVCMRRGRL